MNRTDRLYALVEELRAVAPRPRSARWLAQRFEVSVRTVERDLDALRQSGVPIWAEPGRTGGYALDRDRTLPPLALTAAEALAISVALRTAEGSPFDRAARSAAQKVHATLPADVRSAEERLTGQVFRLAGQPSRGPAAAADEVTAAVIAGRVLDVTYVDAGGRRSCRAVEPLGGAVGDGGLVPHGLVPAAVGRARVPPRPHRRGVGDERTGAAPRRGPGTRARADPGPTPARLDR